MTTQNILCSIDGNDLNSLCHEGTKGMHWRQHDPNRRWQRQAVYANGQSNPDAKERIKKNADKKSDKTKTVDDPIKRIKGMSIEQLDKSSRRLRAENDYLEQLARQSSAEAKYKEAIKRSSEENRNKIFNAIRKVGAGNRGVILGNLAMLGGKYVVSRTVNKEFANKLFKGTRIGDKNKK